MGESLVEAPKVENKMGESVTHVPCLQESVSFGRFEHDSLCWERWSTFPTNKYLEEVEKCSTPGSVAQKKAYFEAHYKKIAARKAELEQEMKREAEAMNLEDQSQSLMDSVCNSSEEELDVEKSNTHDSIYGAEVENQVADFSDDMSHEHMEEPSDGIDLIEEENEVAYSIAEVSAANVDALSDGADIIEEENEVVNFASEVSEHIDEPNDGADVIEEDNKDLQSQPVEATEASCPNMESPELKKPEKLVFVKEENEVANFTSEVSEHNNEPIDGACIFEENKDEDFCLNTESPELKRPEKPVFMEEESEAATVTSEVSEQINEPIDGTGIIEENKDLQPQPEDATEALSPKTESLELKKPEEPVFVKEAGHATPVSQDKHELPRDKAKQTKLAKKVPADVGKLETPKKMQKATSVKKTTNSASAMAKPTSTIPKRSYASMPKSPMLSTPKSTKPVLSKTAMSTTRPSVKKENGFTPLTDKKSTRPGSKRVLPTSLHMSFSLGPANSDPAALTTTRKSLIMERMGDKDIVKRAFKAFQNSNQTSSSSLVREPVTNQSVAKKTEQKGSSPSILQKKKEGNLRSKAASHHAVPQGTAKTSFSPGLRKTIGVDQRNGQSTPASYGTRSQVWENKQKEVSKKLEQKSVTKEAGKTHLQSKVKMEKSAETWNPSQSINSKAKLSSSCNLGRFSKGPHK